MQIKDVIKAIAPIAGSLVGSPVGGMAIAMIGEAIGIKVPTAERVAEAIKSGSLSPEQVAAVRAADAALKVRLRELDLDEKRIEADTEKAYLADAQNARQANSGDRGVFWLGIVILASYALVILLTLFGAYLLLVKGGIKDMDAGLVAAVFSLVGAIIGYIASDAKQVVGYYYGSSRGSNDKSRDMADAVRALGTAAP